MQNRDGVGRRSQSYLPTFGRARVDNAARLIHEYRLPVLALVSSQKHHKPRPTSCLRQRRAASRLSSADRQFCVSPVGYGSMISIDETSCRSSRRFGFVEP
jgi:hypothetical protein